MDWKDVGKAVSPAYAASGFFGDLFSGKKGINAANSAAAAQRAATEKAYTGARQQTGQGYDQADSYLRPYQEQGDQANDIYRGSLGLTGEAGAQQAQQAYQTGRNPYLEYEQDQAQNKLLRMNNAGGSRWSGANAAAVAKARMGLGYQDNQNWQNRLMTMGQQGAQFGQQRAQNSITRGDTMAGYDINENLGYGNIEGQRYANINKAQTEGTNNLFKLVGTAANIAVGRSPTKFA